MRLAATNRTQTAANLMIARCWREVLGAPWLDRLQLGEVVASEAPRHHHVGELELIAPRARAARRENGQVTPAGAANTPHQASCRPRSLRDLAVAAPEKGANRAPQGPQARDRDRGLGARVVIKGFVSVLGGLSDTNSLINAGRALGGLSGFGVVGATAGLESGRGAGRCTWQTAPHPPTTPPRPRRAGNEAGTPVVTSPGRRAGRQRRSSRPQDRPPGMTPGRGSLHPRAAGAGRPPGRPSEPPARRTYRAT